MYVQWLFGDQFFVWGEIWRPSRIANMKEPYKHPVVGWWGNKLLLNDWQLGWYTLLCGELLLGPLEISLTKNCTFSAALPFETIQCQLDSIEWASECFIGKSAKCGALPVVANIVLRQAGKGGGGFSCEEKQTGKKPSDFTFANARGKTHITAVFGFNFNRFQNLGHRQHNHWKTKPDEAKQQN